nr:MAG TPA: hypothetical protein [Caudoviricetes sp.]
MSRICHNNDLPEKYYIYVIGLHLLTTVVKCYTNV